MASIGKYGWSYEDVLPYFKKAESFNGEGDSEYHGFDGPLSVKKSERTDDELLDVFVKAGEQAGFSITNDFNGKTKRVFQDTNILWPILKGDLEDGVLQEPTYIQLEKKESFYRNKRSGK